jgi:hypothetical protein
VQLPSLGLKNKPYKEAANKVKLATCLYVLLFDPEDGGSALGQEVYEAEAGYSASYLRTVLLKVKPIRNSRPSFKMFGKKFLVWSLLVSFKSSNSSEGLFWHYEFLSTLHTNFSSKNGCQLRRFAKGKFVSYSFQIQDIPFKLTFIR